MSTVPFNRDGLTIGGKDTGSGDVAGRALPGLAPRAPSPYRGYAGSLPAIPVLAPIAPIERPGDISHPQFQQLFDLWEGLRDGRPYPERNDFALSSLAFLLGNLMLIDVLGHPQRLRFRLVGTDIVKRLGVDPTGQWLEDPAEGSCLAALHAAITSALALGRPCMALRDAMPDHRACRFEMLIAPLADATGAINMLIAALVPARAPHAQGAARAL
jgi:hypothetical protein